VNKYIIAAVAALPAMDEHEFSARSCRPTSPDRQDGDFASRSSIYIGHEIHAPKVREPER
jgi:hypothetical protein